MSCYFKVCSTISNIFCFLVKIVLNNKGKRDCLVPFDVSGHWSCFGGEDDPNKPC